MRLTMSKSLSFWLPALLVVWLLVGIGCILLDGSLEPELHKLGRISSVHTTAHLWEQLATTPGIVLFALSGAIVARHDKGRTLLHFVVSVSLAAASVQVLKYLIGRVRPMEAGDSTVFAGPFGLFSTDTVYRIDSMPSGHTTAAFAMALALACRWLKLAWLWIALAAGVGVSRTLVDAHFPSDVILGALLGTLTGMLTNKWAKGHLYATAAEHSDVQLKPVTKWKGQ
jgi:membrane-associated phospholipid phosphatase